MNLAHTEYYLFVLFYRMVLGDKIAKKIYLPQLEVTSKMLGMYDKQINSKTMLDEYRHDDTYNEVLMTNIICFYANRMLWTLVFCL